MTEEDKQNMIHRSMAYEGVRYVHFLTTDRAIAANTKEIVIKNFFENHLIANRWTVDRYTKEVHLNWRPESAREKRLREFTAWEGKK